RATRATPSASSSSGRSPRARAPSPAGCSGAPTRSTRSARPEALGRGVDDHPGEHRGDEHRGLVLSRAERNQRRPGTESRESPADAEHDAARDQARVDVAAMRELHRAAQEAARTQAGEAESEAPDEDRTSDDEGKRRIPIARDVEEADDLARIGHARKDEADAEHESRGERAECVHVSWRQTKTVALPASMNATVATTERGDRREMPHTPWPLVQPEP